jgi:hypothetical protein
MENEHKFEILSSKRLTKSFTQVDDFLVWRSISLSLSQAKEIVLHALDKLNEDSEPLTITIQKGEGK